MSAALDEAKQELRDAARAFAANEQAETRLTIAAVQLARAMRTLADGVDYAKRQAEQEQRKGVQPCPSCTAKVIFARGADGGPPRYIDAATHRPHWCKR
jgi:hypothetical protein